MNKKINKTNKKVNTKKVRDDNRLEIDKGIKSRKCPFSENYDKSEKCKFVKYYEDSIKTEKALRIFEK